MPTHNPYDPEKHIVNVPQEDRTLGYETTDVSVQGVLVFPGRAGIIPRRLLRLLLRHGQGD